MCRGFVLVLLFLFCSFAFGQTVTLKNGSVIKGDIINDTSDFIEVKTSFGSVKVNRGEIKSIDYDIYSVKLKDGTVLKSELLLKTDAYIKILISGSEVIIPRENISSMTAESAPSGRASKPAEEGGFNPKTAEYAVTGLGTVSAGAVSAVKTGQFSQTSAVPSYAAAGQNVSAASTNSFSPAGGDDLSVVDLTPGSIDAGNTIEDFSQMKYIVTLKSGRQVEAVILDMDSDSIKVMTEGKTKTLLRTSILSIVAKRHSPVSEIQSSYKPTHIVVLKSGAEIECALIEDTPEKVKISTEYGVTEISKNAVLSITPIEEKKEPIKIKKKDIKKKPKRKSRAKKHTKERFKELTFFIGLWQPPFKLDLTDEGGEVVSMDDSGVEFGLRYLFCKYKKIHFGLTAALQSITSKDFEFTGKTVKISGEAGYLKSVVVIPAGKSLTSGIYFVGGAGLSMTRFNYRMSDSASTVSLSSIQPVLSVGAGLNKKAGTAILGFEADWSYVKQKESKLSGSDSSFLSFLAKISWRFD